MYSVEVDYVGIPHYYATCVACGWRYENHRDRRRGQREIRKHVAETGHTVQLEKMVAINYTAVGDGPAAGLE